MALVLLKKFYTSVEASLAQSYLASEGVETFLFDVENAWDNFDRVSIPVRMMIEEQDHRQGSRLLAELDDKDVSPGGAAKR